MEIEVLDEEVLRQKKREMHLKRKERFLDIFSPVAAILALLLIWLLLVYLFRIPEYLLPPPQSIIQEMAQNFRDLIGHFLITGYEALFGFGAAIFIGFPCAVLLVWSRGIERAIMPLLVFTQTLPKVAIAPLLLVWLGFGILPKLAVAFLIAFFPIVVATATGLKSVETDMVELIQSMSATRWQEFAKARIPNSLPFFFSGVKVAVILSVIGAIVGEFVGADKGLGYLVLVASGNLETKLLFAAIMFLSLLGFGLFTIVSQLEKILIPWHVSMRQQEAVTEVAY
jgi:NitT/TauT family transport system permease protein